MIKRFSVLISLLVVGGAWELAGRLGLSPLFPPVTAIGAAWWKLLLSGELLTNLGGSLLLLLVGYGLSLLLGLAVGVATGWFKPVDELLGTYLNVLMAAPMAAFVPALVMLFGLGSSSIVASVFLYSFFIIAANTRSGVMGANPALLEMARSFGAGRYQILRRILLPGALPMILTGLRLGFSRAIKGLVIGEMLISLSGLGKMLLFYGGAFMVESVYALVITLVVIAVAGGSVVRFFERRLLQWRLPVSLAIPAARIQSSRIG